MISQAACLIRAVAHLQTDDTTSVDLVESLSKLIRQDAMVGTQEKVSKENHRINSPSNLDDASPIKKDRISVNETTEDRPTTQPLPKSEPTSGANEDDGREHRAIKSYLNSIGSQADIQPEPTNTDTPAARPSARTGMANAKQMPVEDLFPASHVRTILRELVSSSHAVGAMDIAKIVNQVAMGSAITTLPLKQQHTLPRITYWLFDAGQAMLPYSKDKQSLLRNIVSLLGRERNRVFDYLDNPIDGVRPKGQVQWQAMDNPPASSAIVVVSDLGANEQLGVSSVSWHRWEAFLADTNRRQIRTISLNPQKQSRWPRVSDKFTVSCTWEMSTGVQRVRQSKSGR